LASKDTLLFAVRDSLADSKELLRLNECDSETCLEKEKMVPTPKEPPEELSEDESILASPDREDRMSDSELISVDWESYLQLLVY
jgi:hypothetical protein